jgi:hypothetical protein
MVQWKYSINDNRQKNSNIEGSIMTLADILPNARKLSAVEKLKLIRILAEDLEIAENIFPLEPFKTYDLPTPYDSFGVGSILIKALNEDSKFDVLSFPIGI